MKYTNLSTETPASSNALDSRSVRDKAKIGLLIRVFKSALPLCLKFSP